MSSLETRYRRLLVAYPAAHRREYGDEMVGVLLAGARPGQAFPAFGDVVDLLRSGLAMRLLTWPANTDVRRRDASVVAAFLAALALMVSAWRGNVWVGSWIASPEVLLRGDWGGLYWVPYSSESRTLAWLLVVVAIARGWRRVSIGSGFAAGALEVILLATNSGTQWRWIDAAWALVTIPALLLLLVGASGRRPSAILGRRAFWLVVAGFLLCGMSGGFPYVVPGSGVAGMVTILMLTVGAVLLSYGLWFADRDVWPALLPLLAGLSAILVTQPVMEQVAGMPTLFTPDGGSVTAAVLMLVGIPLTVMLLTRLLVAVTSRDEVGEPTEIQ